MGTWDAISSAMASHEEATAQRAVLVVEDEILIRSAAAEFLRGAGYKVIEAANAVEAVAVFASRVQIDLVFSDINMPGSMTPTMAALSVRRTNSRQRAGLG